MKKIEDMTTDQQTVMSLLKEAKEIEQFVVNHPGHEYANLNCGTLFNALIELKVMKLNQKHQKRIKN